MPSAESAVQPLPQNPSLNLLSNIAKQLRKAHRSRDSSVYQRIREHHPQYASASDAQVSASTLSLRDAQLIVAREYGFENWTHLKRRVQTLQNGDASTAIQELMEAANNGKAEEIGIILDRHPEIVNERGGDGTRTALHFAAIQRHADVVFLLLERGADPNVRCVDDEATPLHFSAEHGDLRIAEMLVSYGANVTGAYDVHGLGVIGWACVFYDRDQREMLDYLILQGARHNIFSAVSSDALDEIRSIAQEDPDAINRQMSVTEDFRRPLHQALIRGRPDSVRTLIEVGADLNLADGNGLTALDLAAMQNELAIVDMMLDNDDEITLPAAIALGRSADIDQLMSLTPNILAPDNRWGQLIVFIAKFGNCESLERLLDLGADVNVMADFEGDKAVITALHAAAYRRSPDLDLLRLLAERGADLTKKDTKFNSPASGWAHHGGNMEAFALLKKLEEEDET